MMIFGKLLTKIGQKKLWKKENNKWVLTHQVNNNP